MLADAAVIELVDSRGRLVASIRVARREMFWSEGRFEPGVEFAAHERFFSHLEELSRRFQSGDGEAEALAGLERVWRELNERFEIRERGCGERLDDVGLHLHGDRASVRWG